jgi:aminopeptidase N
MKAATSPVERERYLHGLAEFTTATLIDRALSLALTAEVRRQDAALYLGRLLTNPAARDRTWAFLQAHWAELEPKIKIFGGDTAVVSATGSFCDPEARRSVETFFSIHELPAAKRTLQQALEQIDACVALKRAQAPALAATLGNTKTR